MLRQLVHADSPEAAELSAARSLLTQQRLPSWQPIMTPRVAQASFAALGVPLPVAPAAEVKPGRTAQAFYRNLPVSPKKLRVVANLTPKLYWREAMMQLEFCRKQMAVMVKNAIESAAGNAEAQGLSAELQRQAMAQEARQHCGGREDEGRGDGGEERDVLAQPRLLPAQPPHAPLEQDQAAAAHMSVNLFAPPPCAALLLFLRHTELKCRSDGRKMC